MDKKTTETLAIIGLILSVFVVPVVLASIVYYTQLSEVMAPRVSIDPKNLPPGAGGFLSSKNEAKSRNWMTGENLNNLSVAFIVVSTLLSSYYFAKGRSLKKDRAILYSVGCLVAGLLIYFIAQFALRGIFKSLMSI